MENNALTDEQWQVIKDKYFISRALAQIPLHLPPIAQCTSKHCSQCSCPNQKRGYTNYNLRY